MSIKFTNSLDPDQAWQAYSVKPGQVPNCLLLSSPIVFVIVLLSISARARANIQFTEELGHSIFKQKFNQKFFCVFFSAFCCCCFLFYQN